MTLIQTAYRAANKVFEYCYPAYFPAYSAWKALVDRRERALIQKLVRPGMVAVDIGANIGIYTLFLSRKVGASGCVHAFEPAEANFTHLQQTVRGRSNVKLNRAAVGDHSGTVRLHMSSELNVDHHTFDSGDGRDSVEVPLICLDDYFPAGQQVDVMKIDVQGFELSVLKGASRLLLENRKLTILMEFWPYGLRKASTDPRAIIAFANSLGYSIKPIGGGADSPMEKLISGPANAGDYCNVIMTRLED